MEEPGYDSDERILARVSSSDPDAFAVFYRRHLRAVLAYLMARTRRPDLSADLCAEVFAAALVQADRYDARRGPARAWLLAMASSRLADSARRGQVERRARQRLGMPARELTDIDLERVEELVDLDRDPTGVTQMLEGLPTEQREAVRARVIDDRDYVDIARDMRCSQQVVRQRVSRGLASLRSQLEAKDERT